MLLQEKFLKGKGSPNLSQLDIHAVCGTVKDFLRSLREPLVTHKLWPEFVHTVEAREEHNVVPALYQTLSDLPQPNRDTLAFLILHLRKYVRQLKLLACICFIYSCFLELQIRRNAKCQSTIWPKCLDRRLWDIRRPILNRQFCSLKPGNNSRHVLCSVN